MLFSYFLQYSKLSKILKFYTHGIIGLARENEIIPFAVTGFTLYATKFLNNLEKYKFNTIIISSLIFNLIQDYEIFKKFFGVAYNGIKLNVLSVCLIIIFSFFPIKNIKNKKLTNLLKYLTCYSAGIYYLHRAVQLYFKYIFLDIKKGTFFGLVINYFICYLISFSGGLILKNSKAKYLFQCKSCYCKRYDFMFSCQSRYFMSIKI